MRHGKRTFKLGRTSAHRRCMVANMLKALIQDEQIETTVAKAKHLKRYADRIITLAKRKESLAGRRQAMAELMVRYNTLSPKERRKVRQGDYSSYNGDRRVIEKLFRELAPRFADKQGGYTRIVRTGQFRRGDGSELCLLTYLN